MNTSTAPLLLTSGPCTTCKDARVIAETTGWNSIIEPVVWVQLVPCPTCSTKEGES